MSTNGSSSLSINRAAFLLLTASLGAACAPAAPPEDAETSSESALAKSVCDQWLSTTRPTVDASFDGYLPSPTTEGFMRPPGDYYAALAGHYDVSRPASQGPADLKEVVFSNVSTSWEGRRVFKLLGVKPDGTTAEGVYFFEFTKYDYERPTLYAFFPTPSANDVTGERWRCWRRVISGVGRSCLDPGSQVRASFSYAELASGAFTLWGGAPVRLGQLRKSACATPPPPPAPTFLQCGGGVEVAKTSDACVIQVKVDGQLSTFRRDGCR